MARPAVARAKAGREKGSGGWWGAAAFSFRLIGLRIGLATGRPVLLLTTGEGQLATVSKQIRKTREGLGAVQRNFLKQLINYIWYCREG